MKRTLTILLFFPILLNATIKQVASDGSGDYTNFQFVINDNDTIQIKAGDVIYDSLRIYANNVVVMAYGSGDKPVISGLQTMSSATNEGGNIYSWPLVVNDLYNVLFDGVKKEKGRFPQDYSSNTRDGQTSTTITESLYNGYDFTGAEIWIQLNAYRSATNPITNHSGSVITFTPQDVYSPASGAYKTFIQNDTSLLDANGEWAWRNNKLYVYSSDAITNHTIKASVIDTIIHVTGSAKIEGIKIEGSDKFGILADGTSCIVDGIEIDNSGSGIHGYDLEGYLRIENSIVNDINTNGITARKYLDSAYVSNNTLNNIGIYVGLDFFMYEPSTYLIFDSRYIGVSLTTRNGVVYQYNNVDSCGYNGLSWRNINDGTYFLVDKNFVNYTNIIHPDGAALYTFNGSSATTYDYKGWVTNNIVRNSIKGFYGDDATQNTTITGNVFISCDDGVFSNNLRYSRIEDNLFYDNDVAIKMRTSYNDSTFYLLDDTIQNNVIYTGSGDYFQHLWTVTKTDFSWGNIGFGVLDNNIVYSDVPGGDIVTYSNLGALTLSEHQSYGIDDNTTETQSTTELYYSIEGETVLSGYSGTYIKADGTGEQSFSDGILLGEYDGVVVLSKTLNPASGSINSVLGGYYGGYINGGYYGGSIIGTKQ